MTQQPRDPADPVGDFQRWLIKQGAKSVGRGVEANVRSLLGGGKPAGKAPGDVWAQATSDPPPADAPECAWCPVCRAARLLRTRPDLASKVGSTTETLAAVVADAVSRVDAALAKAAATSQSRTAPPGPEPGEEPPDEPDNRG